MNIWEAPGDFFPGEAVTIWGQKAAASGVVCYTELLQECVLSRVNTGLHLA